MMREEDLIKLGFERTDVSKDESGDVAFHYYTYDFGLSRSISLITPANTDVDEYWSVEIFEDENIVFYDLEEVTNLIKIITKGIVR